jgi:cytochrome P450
MHEFATQLTLRVAVGKMMNVPEELLPGFYDWVIDVFRVLSPIDLKPEDVTTPDDELVASYERLYRAYVTYSAYLEGRRTAPGDDLASVLLAVTGEDGRSALSTDEVLGHMIGVTAAGTDSTAALIVNLVRLFTENPDQLELVIEQPSLWENAVLEGLRRGSIGTQVFRISTRDATIAGVPIPAGSNVYASIASANGDPIKFPDPLRFDVRRANAADHVGFSYGRHHCVGAPLARPEARIAVQALYERLPDLKADLGQEVEFVPILGLRMIAAQQVRWSVSESA